MNDFGKIISQEYCENQILEFETFKRKVDFILEKCAPLKKRYVRANQTPFLNKCLNKQIMKRSHFLNKFLNSKSNTN